MPGWKPEGSSAQARFFRAGRLISRGVKEFYAVPLLVAAVFLALAVVSILADQRVIGLGGLGRAVAPVIGPKAPSRCCRRSLQAW